MAPLKRLGWTVTEERLRVWTEQGSDGEHLLPDEDETAT
jgi:hypothetical protein